jgi:uncharacterized protein YjaG (DUF416 family)
MSRMNLYQMYFNVWEHYKIKQTKFSYHKRSEEMDSIINSLIAFSFLLFKAPSYLENE